MNVVVQDQEVVHRDQVNGEEDGEDTDGDNSALDGEAGAAGGTNGVFVGAHAEAAAAWGHYVLLWNRLLSSVGLLGLVRLLFVHNWLFFSGHHGLFFFHIIICFCNIIIFYGLLL